MSVSLCFNELSFQSSATSVFDARRWVAGLVDTLLMLASHGVNTPLRGIEELHNRPLAPDYPIRKWLNDPDVLREHQTYLRSRLSQAPVRWNDDVIQFDDETEIWDFQYHGRSAIGLGAAVRLDGLAVSLLSDPMWNVTNLIIDVARLGLDDAFEESRNSIRHAATTQHVAEHADWITDSRRTVRDFADMWDRRADLFTSIDFCDVVQRQIQHINPGDPHWHAIMKRLWELDEYFSGWTDGPFAPHEFPCKVTPESSETLKEYPACRTFFCPDGEHRICSWHCRFTPHAGRIHFFPNEATRRGIIGYIGRKMPTVDYPT